MIYFSGMTFVAHFDWLAIRFVLSNVVFSHKSTATGGFIVPDSQEPSILLNRLLLPFWWKNLWKSLLFCNCWIVFGHRLLRVFYFCQSCAIRKQLVSTSSLISSSLPTLTFCCFSGSPYYNPSLFTVLACNMLYSAPL